MNTLEEGEPRTRPATSAPTVRHAFESSGSREQVESSRGVGSGSSRRTVFLVTPEGAGDDRLGDALRPADWQIEVRAPVLATLEEIVRRRPALVLVTATRCDERALMLAGQVDASLGSLAPPIVALVAGDDEETFNRAFLSGAADVLATPIAPALLRVKLERSARFHPVMPSPGSFGPFKIQRVLGHGGFGTVFLSEMPSDEPGGASQEVALKVVHNHMIHEAPESLARFHRESAALKALQSSRVPRFVDAGRIDDSFFCAMEYVPGVNLHSALALGNLSPGDTARTVDDVAAALEDMHAAGIVHRDVKPANVIVTPDGSAKLVDLGLAKSDMDPSVTRADDIVGTLNYMAPELARGEPASPATDAFALGMTARESAVPLPRGEGSPGQRIAERARGVMPRVLELMPAEPLGRIIAGLLEPDPARRLTLTAARRMLQPLREAA